MRIWQDWRIVERAVFPTDRIELDVIARGIRGGGELWWPTADEAIRQAARIEAEQVELARDRQRNDSARILA